MQNILEKATTHTTLTLTLEIATWIIMSVPVTAEESFMKCTSGYLPLSVRVQLFHRITYRNTLVPSVEWLHYIQIFR